MEDDLTRLAGFAGVPLVMAATEGVKTMFPNLQPQFKPGVAVAIGVGWNVGLAHFVLHTPLADAAFLGFAVGLAAAGLYLAGKWAGKALA